MVLIVLCLFLSVGVIGQTHSQYIYYWDTDTYFGHVIYPEAKHDGKDTVVIRAGQSSPEVADLNVPLAPGDTIQTSERRCEIQFDTGTVIRLDRNSKLKIETILAQSLSSRNQLTNLLLLKGQIYVMYKRYVRKELFQIIAPNAAVKLNHNSVALIKSLADGSTDIYMTEGRGCVLYGPSESSIKKKILKKSTKIMVTPDHQAVAGQYEEIEDFDAWNEKLNREFLEFHKGKAVIPLPIQKLSMGVYYFAQKFSNLYGEWLWDSLYGYVWRPFLNDQSYPWGRWMPYYQGRWTSVQGQLFWVPSEPWGWVPYHLGIWMWNKKKGWMWIPGSVFAPAWVDWTFSRGLFCWRPWSIMDWYAYGVYRDGLLPYFAYLIYPDDDRYPITTPPGLEANAVRRVLSRDQLKGKKAAPYPMPKEFKKAYKQVVVALKKGEDWALAPLNEMPNQMLVVSREELNAARVDEKVMKLSSLSQDKKMDILLRKSQQNPYRQARNAFVRNEKIASLREKISDLIHGSKGPKDLKIQKFQLSGVMANAVKTSFSMRFRDWNPDVKAAQRAGVSIRYSSRTNEVRCPELHLSSRQVEGSRGYRRPRVYLTSGGSAATSGSQGAAYMGSFASSSQSSASGSKASSSGSRSGGSASKGGKVKK